MVCLWSLAKRIRSVSDLHAFQSKDLPLAPCPPSTASLFRSLQTNGLGSPQAPPRNSYAAMRLTGVFSLLLKCVWCLGSFVDVLRMLAVEDVVLERSILIGPNRSNRNKCFQWFQ